MHSRTGELSMKNKTRFLQTVEIFKTLNFEELTLISKYIQEKHYSENDKLFSQGEQGKEFFIVADGNVSINIELPDGGTKKLAEFGSGNFFGDLILFDDAPRSATCISET